MKLYYSPNTRANKCRWVLEELGVPHELVRIDMEKGEHRQPAYRKVHPLGLIPALEDEGRVILESNAICLYAADKHLDRGLAPPPTDRGGYYQWIFYVQATIEQPFMQLFAHTRLLSEEKRSADKAEEARQKAALVLQPVEEALQGRQTLLDHFSTADILMGSMLSWGDSLGLLEGFPACRAYVQSIRQRPARQRAYAD